MTVAEDGTITHTTDPPTVWLLYCNIDNRRRKKKCALILPKTYDTIGSDDQIHTADHPISVGSRACYTHMQAFLESSRIDTQVLKGDSKTFSA
jgi:hypothetical protein